MMWVFRLASVAAVVLSLFAMGGGLPAGARQEPSRGIVALEFSNSELHGMRSLLAYGNQFTHLQPRWFHLDRPWDGQLSADVNPTTIEEARSRGIALVPILDNFEGSQSRPDVVRQILTSPTQRADLIQALVRSVTDQGFAGIDIHFLGLEEVDRGLLADFVRSLAAALRPGGRILIVSEFAHVADPESIRALGEFAVDADYVRALIYGEHNLTTEPGAIASTSFFNATLDAVRAVVPPSKLIVGISMVGSDWDEQGKAREIDFPQAMALARTRGGEIQWDAGTGSLILLYSEDGQKRRAYFEDALTLSNKIQQARLLSPAGLSFIRLGAEDPSIWPLLRGGVTQDALQGLDRVGGLPFQVIGAGEIWDVPENAPKDGRRQFAIDPQSGRVSDIHYTELPAPYVLDRTGVPADGKRIAITFDDGPSTTWTPKVLDLLSQYHVPATFFVVGRHALANTDLIRREFNEGHEIGNHTFSHISLLSMSDLQAVFELNAARYIVAGVTGRNMRYFRSPFIANPNPQDEDPTPAPGYFLVPQLRARQFGYLTVGNNLDPRDWERPGDAQIITAATNRSLDPPGYIILLHDSGGDRSQTLRALPAIIEFYRSEGFQFTTVSGLLGLDRDFGMPPVQPESLPATQFVALGFNVLQTLENILLLLLYLSIGMGLARTVGLLGLAFVHYTKRRPDPFDAQEIQPFVSVLVPAYNEEKVIGNTIESLLASHYQNYEVLVIDDGSRDGTLATARKYEHHPQVRIIAKENGGKSSALNVGIQEARGEVIIAMDADTVFHPDFIPYVLGHFRDPSVAAASGNAKVGNREDLIAGWQSIEYITSFNLDRRAYTLLNCVTVVPGAAGAWRKRDLVAVGGFGHDTLAEDADVTVKVRRLGRRIVYEDRALAWTEAPNTVGGFVKQRRRWSYGSLQVLTKHRDVLFRPRYGALGFVAFPSAILYLAFTLIAPAIDVAAIWSVASQIAEDLQLNRETAPGLGQILASLFWVEAPKPLLYYVAFVLMEWVQSAIAFWMDRERPWPLLWVPVQRFVLRWLMYYVLFATFITALKGFRVGWGKLERKGTVLGSTGASRTA